MTGRPATVDITIDGSPLSTYNLPSVVPSEYSWEGLLDEDQTGLRDTVTFFSSEQVSVA